MVLIEGIELSQYLAELEAAMDASNHSCCWCCCDGDCTGILY